MMPDDDYPHPLGLHGTENREREARASLDAPAGSVVWTDKTPKKRAALRQNETDPLAKKKLSGVTHWMPRPQAPNGRDELPPT